MIDLALPAHNHVVEKAITQHTRFKGHKRGDVMVYVDYTQPKDTKRLFIIDIKAKKILKSYRVAHGSGSSLPNGQFGQCSNVTNSHMSSCGAVLAGKVYYGKYGRSLRLHGQEKGLNDHIYRRAIVLHGSNYVSERKVGDSWGCLSVNMKAKDEIINQIKENTLIYLNGRRTR